jgi:hypothetical protein
MSTTTVKIPEEWDRNAPHFDSTKPEDLQQFLDHMESLMEKAKTPQDEKKGKLVRYADYTSKREWMSLPSYRSGSYDDFIKEIIAHYPSIRDSEKGSVSQLNKLLARFPARSICMDDQDELMDFIRPLQVQVKRLIPDKLTNKTAIARFMEKLDADFVSRIWNRLDMDEVARNMMPVDPDDAAAVAARAARIKARETERYLFEEVIAVAREIAKGSTDRGEYDFGVSTSGTEKVNRRAIKSEVDSVALNLEKRHEAAMEEMKQWSVQMLDKFELSQRRMEQFMKSVSSGSNAPRKGESSGNTPAFNRPMTLAEIICHYCRTNGHMVMSCEHRRRHIEEGLLKVNQGKDCLADGSPLFLPRDGRSKKDFVEDYYKKKSSQNYAGSVAGVFNVTTDMEEALFPNGTDYDPRNDEILSLRVTEANLKRQLAQMNHAQGERTIQLVQQQQPVGVVQPTPTTAPLPTSDLAQAFTLLSTVAQQMQQTQQQLLAQTRANASRTGTSQNNEGF